MKEALIAGTAEASYRLLEQFRSQDQPAYCGLGTLVMTLNALDIDPVRVWKDEWRWYHEDILDCCEPLSIIQEQGVIFENFCRLASCNGAVVHAHQPDEDGETLDVFRQRLRSAVSNPAGPICVVSYSRKAFEQNGDGHYAPVAAYHEELDAALILDVARLKLPPHWVPLPLLWEALQYEDSSTGRCRGYALLSRQADYAKHRECQDDGYMLFLTLPRWSDLRDALKKTKAKLEKKPASLLEDTLFALYLQLHSLGGLVCESPGGTCTSQNADLRQLKTQVISQLDIDDEIVSKAPWRRPHYSEENFLHLFPADVLALPPESWLPDSMQNASFLRLLDVDTMPHPLSAEVKRLRKLFREVLSD